MIDELEPKTRTLNVRAGGFGVTSWTPLDDVTIRAAYLTAGTISTDPTFDGGDFVVGILDDFHLRFDVSSNFQNLAFPVPAGKTVFFANNTVTNTHWCLIYT